MTEAAESSTKRPAFADPKGLNALLEGETKILQEIEASLRRKSQTLPPSLVEELTIERDKTERNMRLYDGMAKTAVQYEVKVA